MTIEIDVTKLSKEESINLVKDMLEHKLITKELIDQINEEKSINGIDMSQIEAMIRKHFEEYDEVFRKLA